MAPLMLEDLHYTIKKPGLSIAPHREHGHVFGFGMKFWIFLEKNRKKNGTGAAQFNFLNFLAVFTV